MTQGGSSLSGREAATIGNWLSDREYETTRVLERATLVIEAHPGIEAVEAISAAYSQYSARTAGPSLAAGAALVRKYPALTLLLLVMHASGESRTSDFWDRYWTHLGLPREAKAETELRQAVPKLIRRFGLAEFPRLRSRYVQLIGMQAGIPLPCLRGLVDVMIDHLARGGEPNGAAFTHWLTDPRKPHRLARVDIPVRTFVTEGGQYAIDLVDRIIDVVAIALGNPTTWQQHQDSIEDSSKLPKALFAELATVLADCDLAAAAAEGLFDSDGHIEPPRLRLDTSDGSVQLLIPSPPARPEDRWQVSADGDITDVLTPEPLISSDGARASAPHANYPVLGPARHVTVEHSSIPRRFVFPLVDPKDPLVLFSDGGKLLPPRQPIPLGTVHALVPRGHHLVDAATRDPIEADEQRGNPVGWHDWKLLVVDTTSIAALQLLKDDALIGTPRAVRRGYLPEVLLAEPIRGVTAANGSPLYNERPAAWLPADAVGSATQWLVGSRRLGAVTWVANYAWTLEDEELTCDPFEDVPEGLLGTYEIVIRGPLGTDIRKVVHLAEGFAATAEPDYRVPTKDGLSNATITLQADPPLEVDPTTITVAGDDADSIAVLTGPDSPGIAVVISPPRAETRLGRPGEPGLWSSVPHVITPADLDSDDTLAYRVPASTDINTWVELRDRTGKTRMQEPPSYNEHADAFEVELRTLREGMGRLRSARIVAVVQAEDEAPHDVLLATVRPAELLSGLRLVDGTLVLDDLADVTGITVQAWLETAPWHAPATLPVRDDTAELPEEFREAGPLRVRVLVQDHHNPVLPPATPPAGATRIEQAGWHRSSDHALEALSRFIAGDAGLPTGMEPGPQAWTALQALASANDDAHAEASSGLRALLAEQPREALVALTHSTVPIAEQPALTIETGVVRGRFTASNRQREDEAAASEPASPEARAATIGANPWATCLATLDDLLHARRGSDSWVQAREELAEHGGDALIRVLDSGRDTELAKALFDHTTVMLHHMPAEQVDKIFDVARIIPGAVLDVDTRVSAIAETFAMREQWVATGTHTELIVRSKKFIRAIRKAGKQFYDQISIRSDALGTADTQSHPWLMLPMVSLIMALLARLEAHGALKPGMFDEQITRAWADLARICPQLVRIDLVFAEALIAHARLEAGADWEAASA
ncbi:hypothetical protein HT102_06510 [Hoyosella sp. G463]|uniref:Uncharacterized protein n=1 Tax=Lolliginicoccus lacisalsi TaxID=2742202 RepID=A0A927JBQ4_9ACTN|nr:hypothetical protein [Lolliginicoccus lacisalsi]MBD8506131.1 hypothetical protein [Lolliginicoccus lacisalsi]